MQEEVNFAEKSSEFENPYKDHDKYFESLMEKQSQGSFARDESPSIMSRLKRGGKIFPIPEDASKN